jgi:RNA-binding protein
MSLTTNQTKTLRGLTHSLKPVVMVGQNGLKDTIFEEIETALDFHELIKVKIAADRDEREEIIKEILKTSKAEKVQQIGQVLVLFRRNPENPKIVIPSR